MTPISPTRAAIIIGSQSHGNRFLPGVERDPERMANYLQSPNGGRWYQSEIIMLTDPSRAEVLRAIESYSADYLYIYFSGHGYTNQKGNRMLCLSRGEVCDLELLNDSPRQVIVADCCRTHVPRISGIPWGVEKWQYFTGYSAARAAFDQYILLSPHGKLIVHAAADDRPAYDNDERRGGQFSLALLDSMYALQQTGQTAAVHYAPLLCKTAMLLAERKVMQTPSVAYRRGNVLVPFGMISPDIIAPPEYRKQNLPADRPRPQPALAMLAGIILLGYVLSKS